MDPSDAVTALHGIADDMGATVTVHEAVAAGGGVLVRFGSEGQPFEGVAGDRHVVDHDDGCTRISILETTREDGWNLVASMTRVITDTSPEVADDYRGRLWMGMGECPEEILAVLREEHHARVRNGAVRMIVQASRMLDAAPGRIDGAETLMTAIAGINRRFT